jgi:hypothetical protein
MTSTCEYTTWTVDSLADRISRRQIGLPKFQRGVSWNLDRQKKLIGSIRQGFPIGTLLLSKSGISSNSVEKYSIIDGLQRTTAILRYIENPTKFVGNSDSDILDEWRFFGHWVIDKFVGLMETDGHVNELIHRYISGQELDNIDRLAFYEFIASEYPGVTVDVLRLSDQLKGRFDEFRKSVRKSLDIGGVNVPVIIYEGDESLLPDVFERLNSQGVPLNKYQIFAATWQDRCSIRNEDVIAAIKSFYLSRLTDSTLEIDDIDEDGMPEELTLFDYLTGLGSMLVAKFPVLFDSSWSDFIAFQIATVAHKLPIGSMKELPSRFQRDDSGLISTDSFTDALLATCESVSEALEGRLSLKLNRSNQAEFPGHSAFLIDTMITLLLVDRYQSPTWSARPSHFGSLSVQQLLRRWYLIDRLKDVWGNAGDSQFFRRVWTTSDDHSQHVLTEGTLTSNTIEELEATLEKWFEDQLERRDKSRKNVTQETKLVLRYFYYNVLSVGDENDNYFHLDHLVPVAWWSKFFKLFSGSAGPVNSVGNLCLMVAADNGHKKKTLPLSWLREREEKSPDPQFSSRCRTKYFLIEPAELGYPEIASPIEAQDPRDLSVRDAVLNGLISTSRKRWEVMKKGIVDTLSG